MLRVKLLLVATIGCGFSCWAQGPVANPKLSERLAQLHSKRWTERSAAFEALRSNPTALRSRTVQTALIDLLDRENKQGDANVREAQDTSRQHQQDNDEDIEGRGEYYGQLVYTVDAFANWKDPHQICVLIRAGDLRLGDDPVEVGVRAPLAIPCLFQMSESDLAVNRAAAMPMLAETLAKARRTLDPEIVQKAKQIILNSLHDKDAPVRSRTVDALADFGSSDLIPALQDVARSDPAFEPDSEGKGQIFVIRQSAANAIAEIQKRDH